MQNAVKLLESMSEGSVSMGITARSGPVSPAVDPDKSAGCIKQMGMSETAFGMFQAPPLLSIKPRGLVLPACASQVLDAA